MDHTPLTMWCFGLRAPSGLAWQTNGRPVDYWYTLRLEHIHKLPEPWSIDDDFKRVLAWQSLGVDDVIDVSVPWSVHPDVTWQDSVASPSGDNDCPVLVRDYQTPAGPMRHAVRQTGEDPGQGWVVQPDVVQLFEDYNIPRAAAHIVGKPEDIPAVQYLYSAPDEANRKWFNERMSKVRPFAETNGVAVQAWSGFGMDALVWLCGVEGAIMMAMTEPEAFAQLRTILADTDLARTELAASTDGVDMVVCRGWYSSIDFWSPGLFDLYVLPHIKDLADTAHRHNKLFGYVMTTGIDVLGPRLADAGVDVLYFVDPTEVESSLEGTRDLLGGRMTLVGGISSVVLGTSDPAAIRESTKRALDIFAPTNRFILHPVDSVFPDTPWESIETLIRSWVDYR